MTNAILEGARSADWTGKDARERPDPPEENTGRDATRGGRWLPFTKSRSSHEGSSPYRRTLRNPFQAQENNVDIIHGEALQQTHPVKTITISKSSDIRRMMLDHQDDCSCCDSVVNKSRIEPLSASEKREMCKFLVDTRDSTTAVSEIRRGIIAVYKNPSDPTSMVEIFRDRGGNKKKRVHRMPSKKMTVMQKLGLQSCRVGGKDRRQQARK
jgi:hypothetical protein